MPIIPAIKKPSAENKPGCHPLSLLFWITFSKKSNKPLPKNKTNSIQIACLPFAALLLGKETRITPRMAAVKPLIFRIESDSWL